MRPEELETSAVRELQQQRRSRFDRMGGMMREWSGGLGIRPLLLNVSSFLSHHSPYCSPRLPRKPLPALTQMPIAFCVVM